MNRSFAVIALAQENMDSNQAITTSLRLIFTALFAAVLFWLAPRDAQGQGTSAFSVLHTFTDGADGAFPGALTLDAAGNLVGVAQDGANSSDGVLYRLIPATGAYNILYSFPHSGQLGESPGGGLVRSPNRSFYGVTLFGGASSNGVVFRLDPSGSETVLHDFNGNGIGIFNGTTPTGTLVEDPAGNLFGLCENGGTHNRGVVFQITAAGAYNVLHSFANYPNDGASPAQGLLRANDGALYGVTRKGGRYLDGTVFKLTAEGTETIVHTFSGEDGMNPSSRLIEDAEGNLYGLAGGGGPGGFGVVYKLDKAAGYSILYAFSAGIDGGGPNGDLFLDTTSGSLYGTAQYGGIVTPACLTSSTYGCGVVFKVDPFGNESVLYSFTGTTDGDAPDFGVTGRRDLRTGALELYGTTGNGGVIGPGNIGFGTVFRITVPQ